MSVLRLLNPLQHYAWGSRTSIPKLLGMPTPADEPCAEMWMGAHPKAPSLLEGGLGLSEFIAQDPRAILGTDAFGPTLPFLFKILAADAPLSIQCHPNIEQAQAGFANEEAAGIARDAPNRNYRDANHKPELIVALEEFWALKGFREPQEIATLFTRAKLHSAQPLLETLQANGLKAFYTQLLALTPTATRTLLSELKSGLGGLPEPEARWSKELLERYPDDQSSTSALVLRLVRLDKGEGLFLGTGELHAYLRGTGLEIMANSDNVLRGGLTPKHVDPSALVRVLRFSHSPLEVLSATGEGCVRHYTTPCNEFALSQIALDAGERAGYMPKVPCAQIWLCLGAHAELTWHGGSMSIKRGDAVFVTADTTGLAAQAPQDEVCELWIAGYSS